MKNPITILKHLIKDPINTIEEADTRKKEIMPWLYGSIGVAVLFCVLPEIIGLSFLMIIGLVGVAGVMLFGFLLFVIKKAKEKFRALTCDGCNTMAVLKTPEEFSEYVSYTVVSHQATYGGISHPASNNGVVSQITAKASAPAVVSINLKCPNCGKVKTLKYVITPFKCSCVQKNVAVRDVEMVKARLETAVKEVVADYNDAEKYSKIPYTIQSIYHPDYENRTKPQVGGSPKYNGVTIDYHREIEELVRGFFLENELNGTITVE